jgi:hypothetical protein
MASVFPPDEPISTGDLIADIVADEDSVVELVLIGAWGVGYRQITNEEEGVRTHVALMQVDPPASGEIGGDAVGHV